jgi:hypothetical protein
MKKSELKRRSPMPRRSAPLRVRNASRAKQRLTDAFGDKAAWIRTFPCVVREHRFLDDELSCYGYVECAHVRSRAAGGRSNATVPLCKGHHSEQHAVGIKTFAAKYGLDLEALAAEYESLWRSLEAGTQESEK